MSPPAADGGSADSDADAPVQDSRPDTPPDAVIDTVPDADAIAEHPESGADAPADTHASDAPQDGVPPDQDAPGDASPESSPDSATRAPGQCKADSDCVSFPDFLCDMTVPGGQCECGTASDCLDPFEYECYWGRCVKSCSSDEGCPAGLRCATDVHRCELVACSVTDPCPAPYVCREPLCRRPSCEGEEKTCPIGMTCGALNTCVEIDP